EVKKRRKKGTVSRTRVVHKSNEKSVSKRTSEEDIEEIFSKLHDEDYHRFDDGEVIQLRKELLAWYDQNKRDLPWRLAKIDTPEEDRGYAVWVSEIMLQQTRVQTVLDYYRRWISKWPDVTSLAAATLEVATEPTKSFRELIFLSLWILSGSKPGMGGLGILS